MKNNIFMYMKNKVLKNFIATNIRDYIIESLSNKILYHGSYNNDLTKLNPYTNKIGNIPPSIFLTTKKSVAKNYGDNIYRCKILCENIIEIDVNGQSFHDYTSFEYNIRNSYNDGYDCVIFKNIMDSKEPNKKVPLSDVYVVFDSDDVIILNKL